MRKLSDLSIRFELPESRIKKINPLNKETAISIITKMMKSLMIICYTSQP